MVCVGILDILGPTHHEMMVLTGLMGIRMFQKAYLKHSVFPVLMLGSKARIIQAHMSPEQQHLQLRYSELFDFRNLTKEWLDLFVRWFLSEPLTVLSLPHELDSIKLPESSDDDGRSLVSASSRSQKCVSDGSRTPE